MKDCVIVAIILLGIELISNYMFHEPVKLTEFIILSYLMFNALDKKGVK